MLSTLSPVLAAEGGGLGGLLIFPLMIVGAYLLIIRPQRRRMKEQTGLQRSLAEGDEVITTSGMYGFITGFDGDIVWLEIDDNIQIRVARQAVQRKVDTSATSPVEAANSTAIDDIVDEQTDK